MGGLRPGFVAGGAKDEKVNSTLYARISQETFDEAVKENIEDLDMAPDEALEDAVEQFTSQGINLSNIVRRVPGASAEDDPAAVRLARALAACVEGLEDEESEELLYGGGVMRLTFLAARGCAATALGDAAAALKREVQRGPAEATTLAGATSAVDSLVSGSLALVHAEPGAGTAALVEVLEALTVLLMDAENRERLGVRGCAALVLVSRVHAENGPPLRACFQALRAAMLVHEQHRQTLVKSGGVLKLAVEAVRRHGKRTEWADQGPILAACGVGHEHAKAAVELGLLPLLLEAARSPLAASAGPLSELLATLSRLTVTDTICQQLAKMDALKLAISELANHVTDAQAGLVSGSSSLLVLCSQARVTGAQVAKQACFFLANISGNDKCKESIREGSGHIAIAMLLHAHVGSMQTDGVSALGNMALRKPENCAAIAECGGIPAIACLAIRNLVGRNPELVEPILDAGAEAPIREVMNAHADDYMHNLAKAALRDLRCSVQLGVLFTGEVGEAHCLAQGEAGGENHWDKFLETPGAQAAARAELEALGVEMGGGL
ncbi:hypothetical protein EMIHUDRAFT_450446 [Emiliania huxleyi CCMP1516]|uniref:Armadillo repeat-containing protein 6 n=2 Tax=Emiliania huxleyi TaxID=2903 RepID=A0A0D3JNN7_EMIH1|nr:hypothetical protein EMIHUDRAFT_450446 [Emiliania huxleyi CCMP1516]EOD25122.1 hypothetical protein EMIHUDRAFT_450446 [Emiliania huxleyi CCMP1516]|eukprot:XP_005777551.1 hypothetical protein EMIHUDRAFT_450446 [Emiliania huxleyi CCMP1516]